MDDMKRRVPPQALILAAALLVILVMSFGLFGPSTEAEEGVFDTSTDEVLTEATFYVA